MDAIAETISFTRRYYQTEPDARYWRVCTCGHRILRTVLVGGRFPIFDINRCPQCGRPIKGY